MKFLLILVLFIPFQVHCRCRTPIQLDIKEYNEADLIFIGKLIKINHCRLFTYSIQFEVKKIYKGKEIQKKIQIKTNKWPIREDGFYGKIGMTYIIVSNKVCFGYFTNACYPNSVIVNDSLHFRDSLTFIKDSLFLEFMSLNKNSRIDSTMNTNITGSGQMKNGVPDGLWTYYNYRHGIPYAFGRYIDGKMDSTWNFYSDTIPFQDQKIYSLLQNYDPIKQRLWIEQEVYANGKIMADVFISSNETRKVTYIEIEIYSKKAKINYNDYSKIKGKVYIHAYKYTFLGRKMDIIHIELKN